MERDGEVASETPEEGADDERVETPPIFQSDTSISAEQLAQLLRAKGYWVVDIHLSLLVSRCSSQRPSAVLIDADAEGVLDVTRRLRELPGGETIPVLSFGDAGEAESEQDGDRRALQDLTTYFTRPVEATRAAEALLRLIPPPTPQHGGARGRRDSREPRDLRDSRDPSALPSGPAGAEGGGAAGDSANAPRPARISSGIPRPRPSVGNIVEIPPSRSSRVVAEFAAEGAPSRRGTKLSPELSAILAAAEERIARSVAPSSTPRPSEDLEVAPLSPSVLASLSEVLQEASARAEGRAQSPWLAPGEATDARGTAAEGDAGSRTDAGEFSAENSVDDDNERSADELDHPFDADMPTPPPVPARTGARGGSTTLEDRVRERALLDDPPASVLERERGAATTGEADPPTPRLPGHRGRPPLPEDAIADSPPLPARGFVPSSLPPESTSPEIPRIAGHSGDPADLQPLAVELPHAALPTLAPPRQPIQTIPSPRGRGADALPPLPSMTVAPLPVLSMIPSSSVAPSPPPGMTTGPRLSIAPEPEPPAATLLEADALRVLGQAITRRHTGCLCFDGDGGLRRVVLRDGDLVAVSSTVENESLVAYLTDRGELPRDVGKRLLGRVPPFGRLAGAALIAAGHLMQDRLWEVLRAHAEWIVGRILLLQRGSCGFEREAPGRLKTEPGMFGGSTGAEVFVEVVRRVLDPAQAITLLGGPRARLAEGTAPKLLAESALAHNEEDLLTRIGGAARPVHELLDAVPPTNEDFAAALFALVALSVLESLPAGEIQEPDRPRGPDPLDEEALRGRVRARLELVEEGDYFTLLGVPHTATGYEIKRAYLALRRSYDPGKVVTPNTLDLVDSLRLIAEVLDEAYDILRDPTRRERYARAIDAKPSLRLSAALGFAFCGGALVSLLRRAFRGAGLSAARGFPRRGAFRFAGLSALRGFPRRGAFRLRLGVALSHAGRSGAAPAPRLGRGAFRFAGLSAARGLSFATWGGSFTCRALKRRPGAPACSRRSWGSGAEVLRAVGR
jgi:hypothetical protein